MDLVSFSGSNALPSAVGQALAYFAMASAIFTLIMVTLAIVFGKSLSTLALRTFAIIGGLAGGDFVADFIAVVSAF